MSDRPIEISDAVIGLFRVAYSETELAIVNSAETTNAWREATAAGLRAAITEWARERSTDAPLTGRHAHAYQSTACAHFRHSDCRLTCKWCRTSCLCECHDFPVSAGEPKAQSRDLRTDDESCACAVADTCRFDPACPNYAENCQRFEGSAEVDRG